VPLRAQFGTPEWVARMNVQTVTGGVLAARFACKAEFH
jgi:hypothetical protein